MPEDASNGLFCWATMENIVMRYQQEEKRGHLFVMNGNTYHAYMGCNLPRRLCTPFHCCCEENITIHHECPCRIGNLTRGVGISTRDEAC